MAGEGGKGPTSEGESAGGSQEEAGGAETEGGETSSSAGGETETEARKEQGKIDGGGTVLDFSGRQNYDNYLNPL